MTGQKNIDLNVLLERDREEIERLTQRLDEYREQCDEMGARHREICLAHGVLLIEHRATEDKWGEAVTALNMALLDVERLTRELAEERG